MASWLKSIGKVNTDQNKDTNGQRAASTSSYEDNPEDENKVNDNPGEFAKLVKKFIDDNENIELKSNTAFEYQRNQNNYCIINLREYYLSYYPSFGEITIGKQIIAEGFNSILVPPIVLKD